MPGGPRETAGPTNQRSAFERKHDRERVVPHGMNAGLEVSAPAAHAGIAGSDVRDDPFVLESRGWSSEGTECTPKIVALASLMNLAAPDPVASVSYKSRGNLLIVAGESAQRARDCATRLAQSLAVTLLDTGAVPSSGPFAVWAGRVDGITGYLGEFTVAIADLAAAGATRAASPTPARFDLVLDFSAQPLFAMRQPPQGYFAAPAGESALEAVLDELRGAVGEFEKRTSRTARAFAPTAARRSADATPASRSARRRRSAPTAIM